MFIFPLACLLFIRSSPAEGVQIKLTGSESRCCGIIAISYNDTWGTVCQNGWDMLDAEVVCRELNCGKALRALGGSYFEQGKGPVWLDNVNCSGEERSLTDCRHSGFLTHHCDHSQDAWVICSGFSIRLTGSESRCSGRVELFFNDTWGTVCDDGWDMLDAEVVCRELNCGEALKAPGGSYFGPGEGPVWLDNVNCSGGERSLTDCRHSGFLTHNRGHSEDAGVICSGVQIRLTGSESRCSGRVEILFDHTWGTVCDDGWDMLDAEVVCRELNCGEALEAPGGSYFGEGKGPIWLYGVDCLGGERSLSECRHRGFLMHHCDHNEDAGVICSGSKRSLTDCSHSGAETHNCDQVSSLPLVYEITRILLLLIMVSVVLFVICKTKRQASQRASARVEYRSNNEEESCVNMVVVDTEKNLKEEAEKGDDYESISEDLES